MGNNDNLIMKAFEPEEYRRLANLLEDVACEARDTVKKTWADKGDKKRLKEAMFALTLFGIELEPEVENEN